MLILGLYILVMIVALLWIVIDHDAMCAFELFQIKLHAMAREMGIYWKWANHTLGRFAFLLMLVSVALVAAIWMAMQNPWEFGEPARIAVLGAMVVGSLAVLILPYLAARLRFARCLYSRSSQLAELVSLVRSETVEQHLEAADYDARDGWSAWHPRGDDWQRDKLWRGLVPVAYLRRGFGPSVVVPMDWEHFLAWRLPVDLEPGKCFPFCGPGETTFVVKAVHKLLGRQGWSVVRADMDGLDA
jgi:hypothetical protein